MNSHAEGFEIFGDEAAGGFAGGFVPGMGLGDEEVDGEVQLGEGGGEFDAQHAAADDGGAAAGVGVGVLFAVDVGSAFALGFFDGIVEAVGVAEAAEVKNVGELGAGDAELVGGSAGGDGEFVEGDFFAVIESDHATGGVQEGRAGDGGEA